MLLTSVNAQATDCHTTDSVKISLDDYKYIQKWAEYGVECEKTVILLEQQIAKDAARVEKMEKELNKEREKNKKTKTAFRITAVIAAAELAVIILFIWL